MQLLVLVLAGLVFGFAWFGLLVVSSHLPERDLVSAYHLVLLIIQFCFIFPSGARIPGGDQGRRALPGYPALAGMARR